MRLKKGTREFEAEGGVPEKKGDFQKVEMGRNVGEISFNVALGAERLQKEEKTKRRRSLKKDDLAKSPSS